MCLMQSSKNSCCILLLQLSDSEARLQDLQARQQSTLQELQEATQQLTHLHNTLQQQDTQQVQNGNLSQEVQVCKLL